MDQDPTSDFIERLNSARQGDKDRQGEFLDNFRGYLKKIAQDHIGAGLNAKLSASDLVQSAIIDAQQSLPTCRATNRDQFKSWLKQIILNDIVNRIRYFRRQKRDIGLEKQLSGDVVGGVESPDVAAINRENEKRLLTAIDQLADHHQKVLLMYHREGLSFVEIASKMNRSPDAIRMTWNRAVVKLTRALKQIDE